MAKVNLDLQNTNSSNDITDELKNNVGSSAFGLVHDRFFGGAELTIYTGAGETGTLLVQDTDYTLGGLDSDLTAEAIAQVWSTIVIDNVTYQTGNLYFNYHAVADEIDADDFDPDDFITSDGATVFTATGAGFKDEDNMASDSDVAVASQQSIKAYVDALIPKGSITMYGAAAAPTGWVNCDGASLLRSGTYAALFAVIGTTFGFVDGTHFNVPDMRGIFPRGAGTNGTLSDANGGSFAGVLGTYQNDKFQGHKHRIQYQTSGSAGTATSLVRGAAVTGESEIFSGVPDELTASGPERYGDETNPANLGVNFIIKI